MNFQLFFFSKPQPSRRPAKSLRSHGSELLAGDPKQSQGNDRDGVLCGRLAMSERQTDRSILQKHRLLEVFEIFVFIFNYFEYVSKQS